MLDEGRHEAVVDAWLQRSAKNLSQPALVQLFEAALGAMWARTETTLGEVTLTAIAGRVLHNASERFPALSSLRIDAKGIRCGDLREQIGSARDTGKLMDGIRFVLVELLTVLGNLTAEILTPELHAELSNVALPAGDARNPHDTEAKARAP